MGKKEISQEDLFLELKLIAFRKKLEEQNKRNEQVNELNVIYEQEKQKSLQRYYQKVYDNTKQSLPFAIPIGIGNIFLFKSLMVFPITLFASYCAFSIYNNKKK